MDTFLIQYKYRSWLLIVIDGVVYVYKYENCKFDQPYLSFQTKFFLLNKKFVK